MPGFEIVTFAVEGEARDRDEGVLRAGDVLWMTAGSGVVHNEDLEPLGKVRILQLWMTLPSAFALGGATVRAHAAAKTVPVRQEPGVEARVYSGTSGAVQAPSHTYLPMTMVDVRSAPNAVFEQEVPSSYNGFCIRSTVRSWLMERDLNDFARPDRLAGVRRSVDNGSSDRRDKRIARDAVRRRATGCADRDARPVRRRNPRGPVACVASVRAGPDAAGQ